ncbi:MAG TPA: hypothetical protein VGK64_03830 [Bryobacteraceae bacterium]
MPQTTKQVENAAKNPAFCSLIPLLELVDNYEVLRHGTLSALYRVSPLNSYFESDEEHNETSEALHALLRAMPDNRALRLQVRYETTEGVGALLDNFEQQLRYRHPVLAALDRERLKTWRERDERGEFLKRHYTLGFQLDPRLYTLLDESFGQSTDIALLSRFLPGYQIQRSYEEHERIRSTFESLLTGYQSLLTLAGLRYERLTNDELALELLRTLNPMAAYRRPWRPELGNRSLREWICDVGIEDEGPGWQQMNGLLYTVLTMKWLPEKSFPGVMRKLTELDFPVSCSAEIVIPGESKAHHSLTKRLTRTESAQLGANARARTDVAAAVAGESITETLKAILAGRERLVEYSLTVVVRTSRPILTPADREPAHQELVRRRERVRAALIATEGSKVMDEKEAIRRLYIQSLPGLCTKTRRELECSSKVAANFLPVEGPWEGMEKTPLVLLETPMKQLIGFDMFHPSLGNYNMLLVAQSGFGKSFVAQALLLMAARSNPMFCIIEPGVTYTSLVNLMDGRVITVSLDGEHAINAWDLPAGAKLPSNQKKNELKNLTLEMMRSSLYADASESDPAILESILDQAIEEIYRRFAESSDVPTFSELYSELDHWHDKVPSVSEQARKAAIRLKPWVGTGAYASLFDRRTTFSANNNWLYFRIKPLNSDKRLARTYPMIIAQQMAARSTATNGRRSIVALDENWDMLDSPHMAPQVEQSFRTARTNNASIWGISQAIEDYTGFPEKPRPAGPGILQSISVKWIGKQKGDGVALKHHTNLSDKAVETVRTFDPPVMGHSSQMLLVLGENETTQIVRVVPTPLLYWICTSYGREKQYRSWALEQNRTRPALEVYRELARKFPHGLSSLPILPEEEMFAREIEDEPEEEQVMAAVAR